jgi:hypothetical protein
LAKESGTLSVARSPGAAAPAARRRSQRRSRTATRSLATNLPARSQTYGRLTALTSEPRSAQHRAAQARSYFTKLRAASSCASWGNFVVGPGRTSLVGCSRLGPDQTGVDPLNAPRPTAPGEILQQGYLVPLEMSQKDLADHIGPA